MEKEKALFNVIRTALKQTENYVPRDYQTIGGMWTVDTYKHKDITLQVMDEGLATVYNKL